MMYGLYLSATGVLANSYRQDVIANNLANVETVGFKRSMPLLEPRPTEAEALSGQGITNPALEPIGGGLLARQSWFDQSQGSMEQTNRSLDVAIEGRGYFAVADGNQTRLTRNGRFMLDREGFLILADDSVHRVLDPNRVPIQLPPNSQSRLTISGDGTITAGAEILGQIGLFGVADPGQLTPAGGTLLDVTDPKRLGRADGTLRSGYLEGSNVDPMTELTALIHAQRQLEMNANMIRFQDQTMSKLVNEAGKIG